MHDEHEVEPGARAERRDVLGQALLATAALMAAPVLLSRRAGARPATSNGSVLVQVFLRGGMDGLSLLPPFTESNYYASRPALAIPPRDARPVVRHGDDHALAAIFSQALRAAGFEVETTPTVEAALAKLATSAPLVVTLDLHLQHTKGNAILHYIRSEARLAQVNVVITTADSAMAEELQDQADFVLVKPISFVQLRDLAMRLKPPA